MKVNLSILGLIALTTFSCSNESKNIKDETVELIIEQNHEIEKTESSNQELKTTLNDLKTLNDEREHQLSLSNSKNETGDENDNIQKKAMKNTLKELEHLNREQEKYRNEKGNN